MNCKLKILKRTIMLSQVSLAKDPPLKHVYQDGEKEDAPNANGDKSHDKQRSRRSKLSFEDF
jgi:hypothetical protein